MSHSLPNAKRNRLMMLVMLDTGVRSSELVALQVADIDLSGGRLFVRQGKGRKDRVIPFSPHVGKAMWQHLLELGKKKSKNLPPAAKRKTKVKSENQPALDPKDYIFVNEMGYPLERGSLLKLMYSIGERAGVPNTHPHHFRHNVSSQWRRRSHFTRATWSH